MGLVDPVKIYAATSNIEAQLICRLLQGAGIDAFAGEDVSPAGIWLGGTVPGVFDAGVFVSRTDAERAVTLIRQEERLDAERSNARGPELEATCADCGKTATFPAAQQGTVQSCPHCGAYLDVGDSDLQGGFGEESAGEEDSEREEKGNVQD
jgi:ribosomal protein S27E